MIDTVTDNLRERNGAYDLHADGRSGNLFDLSVERVQK